MIPGLVTWGLILVMVPLAIRWPVVLGVFVLCFDFYWMYRAVVLSVSVAVSFRRIRRVVAIDWRQRAFSLSDPQKRLDELAVLIGQVRVRTAELRAAGNGLAARGGKRELRRLVDEQRSLARLINLGEPFPDPRQVWHVALVPTYTEPYEKLYETVRALAESDYPRDMRMVAIITRETDLQGRENVARLREVFGSQFRHFFHILDPLEPGVVVGKSSAMAYGGRWLYRELTSRGFDPKQVVVTDLDSDYRVHKQYFGYVTYKFITDRDRYRRLYQPVPMFHNNLWQCPLPIRLIAVELHACPDVAPPDAGTADQLQLVLGLPADRSRGGLLGDRRDPRGQPFLLEELLPLQRPVPGRAALHADLRRCRPREVVSANSRTAVHPDQAVGVGSDGHPILHLQRHDARRDPTS